MAIPANAASELLDPGRVDANSVARSAANLRNTIVDAIREAGGAPESQHLHLVIGFSTGHFTQDPLRAEAARQIAALLIRDFLVAGDRVSVYAWEMRVWEHREVARSSVLLTEDSSAAKDALQDLFPLTPKPGSLGGHDTEQALVEIAARVQGQQDAIIVLLTNTAVSLPPRGGRVIGLDDSAYHAMRQQWLRLAQVNATGASYVLPYTATPTGKRPVLRMIDAVIMVPRHFSGEAIVGGTRSELLQAEQIARKRKLDPALLLGAILGFAVLGAVLAHVLPRALRPKMLVLDVAGRRYDLAEVEDGEEVCLLVGSGYPAIDERSVVVGQTKGIPSLRLARFTKRRGTVRITGEECILQALDDVNLANSCVLRAGEPHRLVLWGKFTSDRTLPPRAIRLEIAVRLIRVSR